MKTNALATIAALAALLGAACTKSEPKTEGSSKFAEGPKPEAPAPAPASAPAAAPTKDRYPLTGVIRAVDVEKRKLTVQHEEVHGYMPAMTMEFLVAPGDEAVAKVGQNVRAEMIPSKDGDFRLEKIWPADKVEVDAVNAGAMKLRQDTFTRGKNAYREIGEKIPDFALYDQEGRVVQSGRFRGKMVMVNFIFSRCPVATMCPASTLKMMSAQKLAAEAGAKDIEFVSITLDPAYDTPGVLKEYATVRAIDTSNFSFLTGPEAAVRDLLTQFGVIAEFKGDILQHTLTTLLIGEDGRIVHRADGSTWDPKEFVARMKR